MTNISVPIIDIVEGARAFFDWYHDQCDRAVAEDSRAHEIRVNRRKRIEEKRNWFQKLYAKHVWDSENADYNFEQRWRNINLDRVQMHYRTLADTAQEVILTAEYAPDYHVHIPSAHYLMFVDKERWLSRTY